MEINIGDLMVLNTVGKAGFENVDNWANRDGINPEHKLVVIQVHNLKAISFRGYRFGHPDCKFALVGGHNED